MSKKLYYIAYGSNLVKDEMAYRCPSARAIGSAMLSGYKLEFRFYLTIHQAKNGQVPVGVWEIDEDDLARLDAYEGYPVLYDRKKIEVEVGGEKLNALVYFMRRGRYPIYKPSYDYIERCKKGYRDFGLDIHYLLNAYEQTRRLR